MTDLDSLGSHVEGPFIREGRIIVGNGVRLRENSVGIWCPIGEAAENGKILSKVVRNYIVTDRNISL